MKVIADLNFGFSGKRGQIHLIQLPRGKSNKEGRNIEEYRRNIGDRPRFLLLARETVVCP